MNLLRPDAPWGRCEGKSTSIALRALADAIGQPGKVIRIEDHVDTLVAREHTANMMKDYIEAMELKFIRVFRQGTQFYVVSEHIQ